MSHRRRRRKGNPLLAKIVVITLVIHAIALPIAAHFGAFKNIRRGPGDARVVLLDSKLKDEAEKPKEKAKEKSKPTKKASTAKGENKAANNLPQPKVVTSGPAAGDGNGSGPSAESGTGAAGKVPDGGKTTQPTTPKDDKKDSIPEPKKDPEPTKKPDPPKTDPPKTEIKKDPEPKPKKLIEAEVTAAPEPVIPDDLRSEPLDKTLVVEAMIDTGGHPTDVKVVTSTGIPDLDRIGLDTAKKYRFRPATIDGVPSEQRVRFTISFKVE